MLFCRLDFLSGWATHNFLILDYPTNSLVANTFDVPEINVPETHQDVPKNEDVVSEASSGLVDKVYPDSTSSLRPISEDVENGILLLPKGSVTASPTEMFSDEVIVVTTENGAQMVVRIDEDGLPVGKVVPFVSVPVNHSDR